MYKRENQKFYGVLRDKELYMVEDALKTYASTLGDSKKAHELIDKLYSDFAELPQNSEIVLRKEDN